MTWGIVWTETAMRDMASLEHDVARRIVTKLEQVPDDPAPRMKRLRGADEHRLRVGEYRVIALLSFQDEAILVQRVGHPRNVYR